MSFGAGALRSFVASRLGLGPSYRVPILMYHRLSEPNGSSARYDGLCVAPRAFAEQMRFLRDEGFTTLFVSEVVRAIRERRPLPARSVAVSFDDGYASVLENGMGALVATGAKASVYVITEHHRANKPGFLAPEQIVELQRTGLVELGSHSRTHPDLTTLSDARLEDEIVASKAWIEELLGPGPLVFCYPYGRYDRRAVALVERAGYLGALATREGVVNRPSDAFALRRVRVTTEPIATFARKLA